VLFFVIIYTTNYHVTRIIFWRHVSTTKYHHLAKFCRKTNAMRQMYGVQRFILALLRILCCVATLGVGFPAPCLASRCSPSLYSELCVGLGISSFRIAYRALLGISCRRRDALRRVASVVSHGVPMLIFALFIILCRCQVGSVVSYGVSFVGLG
jgi:hypothetical protein